MKKVIAVLSFFVVVLTNQAVGQRTSGKVQYHDLHFTARLIEGLNTVQVPNGKGVIRVIKRGDTFLNMMYQDVTGKIERLIPNDGSSEGAPTPECKCPMPDACYTTANKNIGLCMCKPCELAADGEYNIALLLPAVQKAREATTAH